jgi:serine/threonine-protein kinase RsbW
VTTTRIFPNEPQSVPAARRFAMSLLSGVSPDTLEAIELMVSELATNCVRHTDSGFELSITRTGRDIRVAATDGAAGTPTMRSPKPTEPSGRGLKIIDMLSQTWGVEERTGKGKTVWFMVVDTASSATGRASRAELPTTYPAETCQSAPTSGATAESDPSQGPTASERPTCEARRHTSGWVRPARRRLPGHA